MLLLSTQIKLPPFWEVLTELYQAMEQLFEGTITVTTIFQINYGSMSRYRVTEHGLMDGSLNYRLFFYALVENTLKIIFSIRSGLSLQKDEV